MKTAIKTILALTIFCSCGQHSNQIAKVLNGSNQTETIQTKKPEIQHNDKKIGEALFKSILDTIKIKPITSVFLINNQWIYRPFDNCESYLKFKDSGKGISYNCEMDEDYEMTYRVEGNKVYISEYDIPHVDNVEEKKIKYRDDTFVYNGEALIMVDSRMHNIGGLEWTPEIERVINYDRKKY